MNYLRVFGAAALLLAVASPVMAQPASDSHVNLPWTGGPNSTGAMAKRLNDRLKQHNAPIAGMEPEMARQLLELASKHGKNPEKLKEAVANNPELAEALKNLKLENDPELQKQIAEMRSRPTRGDFTPPKGWEEMLQNLTRPSAPSGDGGSVIPKPNRGPNGDASPGNSTDASTPPDMPNLPSGSTPNIPNLPTMRNLPGETPMPSPSPRSGDAASRDFWQRLERGVPDSLRESPTMKRFLTDMTKTDWTKATNSRFFKDAKAPDINWDRVGKGMQGPGRFFERNLPSMSGRHLPNAPRMSAPNLPSGPSLPNIGGPPAVGVGGMASGATVIVVIAALVLGGLLVWRLLVQPMKSARRSAPDDGLGPWPVDPSQVTSREELVKAFDYLALKQCGEPAKLWHHREVANHLGSDEPRRRSASSLADAYMQARYTPPAEPFDELMLQRARHDLCALAAGVAS